MPESSSTVLCSDLLGVCVNAPVRSPKYAIPVFLQNFNQKAITDLNCQKLKHRTITASPSKKAYDPATLNKYQSSRYSPYLMTCSL